MIGVSGPAVRLADTGGTVVTVSVSGLLAAEDFTVLDARPRPGMPAVSVLDGLPGEAVQEALWWQRHIVEVLRGVPPGAEEGTAPRPEYDPAVFTLTRRELAKAAELTAAGHPVTASAIAKRRRRYQEQGLAGMVGHRAGRRMPPHGRADAAVVAAMRQAIGEAADEPTRTAAFVFRRTRRILAGEGGEAAGELPSERTVYRLFGRLEVFVSESFKASCAFLGISFQPARKATGTDKPHIERMLGSVATMFAQYVSGYACRSPEYRGLGTEDKAVWSLPELQDLLDQWLIAVWQPRPHDGLRDPLHPGRAFTPNEKYAALTETAGYVPLALSPEDHVELLPATWRAVNAYGIRISRRVYDGAELNPLRMQHSGVASRKGLWEVYRDPYDISRVWVRDHWDGGWITVFWTQLHRVAAPFGELAWDHARKSLPAATEAELADAVDDLLTRAGQGPAGGPGADEEGWTAVVDDRVARGDGAC